MAVAGDSYGWGGPIIGCGGDIRSDSSRYIGRLLQLDGSSVQLADVAAGAVLQEQRGESLRAVVDVGEDVSR